MSSQDSITSSASDLSDIDVPELPRVFLITGATGFLGKLVVENLLRRREELNVSHVVILTRPKRGRSPEERFQHIVHKSPCFSKLPPGWEKFVTLMEGDVTQSLCGIQVRHFNRLCREVTHIIHCAASIRFDLPIIKAVFDNVGGALKILEFAGQCRNLERLVMTSTAYVTPHTIEPIHEVLAPLPMLVEDLLVKIEGGGMSEKEILKLTGHENTYTLTKCIAEHMIMRLRGQVPLSIVRPSIISASRVHPFPGWIDSPAAFAGLVIALSSGRFRVLDGDPDAKLDIVPVDQVAQDLVVESFAEPFEFSTPRIKYSVSTLVNALDTAKTAVTIGNFFNSGLVKPVPRLRYSKHKSLKHMTLNLYYHKLQLLAGKMYFCAKGDEKMKKQITQLMRLITIINRAFPYFSHNTFDFRHGGESQVKPYDTQEYVSIICEGVQSHILKRGGGNEDNDKEVKKDLEMQVVGKA
ncbi:male sterility protein-domain-containing protein [Amylocarpus encephaloides]|uniref:Fatty acyl-CoA reductase n=1 Tax=Amylocarpus encephaloides TaxID=45428 RepID=A0A9P8C253_9HELO|nr:male sterility protein-domain-containing protein [Amylocarpus encephaloides]